MWFRKIFTFIFVCLIALLSARDMPAAAMWLQSDALAVVNNQTITLNDIDPRVREMVEKLESEIAEAQRYVLEQEIMGLLFQLEARRRGITPARLLELEVTRRLTDPAPDIIQAIYDANRAQFGTLDLNGARPQIVAYVRRESEQKLLTELAARLRTRFKVVMGAKINSPNLQPGTTLATVGGQPLTAASAIERLKPIIYDLRVRAYEAQKTAVDQRVYSLLVLEEARKQGVAPEVIIRTEVNDKLRSPSEEEIQKFYEENKARINGDPDSLRVQITNYLEQQEQARIESAHSEKLRAAANVRIMLKEPEPPTLAVSADDDPSRGALRAPVTVVVFTDFQCPSCAANHPIIEETIKAYGNRVRLVIRDFPLEERHPQARKAAEAANAAHAQGKFFEYAELLFKNQKSLDIASLKKYATDLGLNRARFDAALDGGVFIAEVSHDIMEGLLYGVTGTPSVFVNGRRISTFSEAALRAEIDRALAQKTNSPATSQGKTKSITPP
ncbi:MAG: thioredoxin domain-containing protein [Pyrinomonadaceae bacterium]|nr:thioredoxin domain-containing protein [Pyrinomonadaceae bacterium]